MTDKNIQEAEVGSGTKVADTKQSEKRAQITLKAIQLRLKQEKERAALQAQKKSLSVKENIEESFSASQIAAMKAEYSKITTVDPSSDTYKKLIAMLDRLDLKTLKSLAGAEIKFVSKLAQNRVARKSVKEEFQLDELSNEKLADYKKKAGADASAADKAGDMKKGNKRFSGIMKATKKQFANDDKKSMTESNPRIPRKEGQPAKSDKHSDLYTDENPKGTIHGLKFATADDAKESVNKIKSSDRTHAHKIQAAVAMEQRAKVMRKKEAAAVYREYIESMKKMTKEELSPKQKALDKNNNGRIDGEDLAKLRSKSEELSPKQKELDKNKNGKIDASDLAKLRGEELSTKQSADDKKKSFIDRMVSRSKLLNRPKPDDEYTRKVVQHLKKKYNKESVMPDNMKGKQKPYVSSDGKGNYEVLGNTGQTKATFSRKDHGSNAQTKAREHLKSKYDEYMKEDVETVNEKSEYEIYHKDYSTAVQTAIKQAEKRGYEVDMDDWHDKVATGPKKPSSGKTNSFSINLMKDGKQSKKKLQMQVYNMDNQKFELNMYIEEVEIAEAGPGLWANIHAKRQRIKAGSNERMKKAGEKGAPKSDALDRARGKNEGVAEATGDKPFDNMMKNIKKGTAKQATQDRQDQRKQSQQQARNAFGPNPAANLGIRKPGVAEGLMNKIKAMKRGMQAKAKADDHFDKAGDPKNANASKDLKKAVRYTNLLNKEEVVVEARKKTLKDMKKKMKTEETPNGSTVEKGDTLTGKREPIEINPELKQSAR